MEYIMIIIFCSILTILLALIFNLNIKKVKQLAEEKQLDDLVKEFPDNVEVCKSILEKLNNKNNGNCNK